MSTMTLTQKVAMATVGAVAAIAAIAPASHAATLGRYTFEGANNTVRNAASSVAANVTFSTFALGGGLSDQGYGGNNSDRDRRAQGWTTGSAVDTNDFFGFTVTPTNGFLMNLTGITFDVFRPNDNGPASLVLRSSLDNFANDIGSVFSPVPVNAWSSVSRTLTGFNALTSPVTFRIYGFGARNANGRLRIDNVSLQGSVQPVPTPALLPGLVGLGLGAWRKRKQAAVSQA